MSAAAKASRTQVWAENLGDWTWPGQGAAAEVLPPAWVPTRPPRLHLADGPAAALQPRRSRARRLLIAVLLSALAAVCVALALEGRLNPASILGRVTPAAAEPSPAAVSAAAPALPTFATVEQDAGGGTVDSAQFPSVSLHGTGSFLVYLPAGYPTTTAHYPTMYMLTGNDQSDSSFLQIGVPQELDRLIARGSIPPVIAVMIQGGPGTNNWRNLGGMRYESYILEVQELVDRTLPTIPARSERAVLGDSMGGYGAMNVALSNPLRFAVVESWLGFFNGLEARLPLDRPVLSQLGLHALLYGGESDHIADPTEDAPFAAALRAAGANAKSAVYPGEHNLSTLEAHLSSSLEFAGRALRDAPPAR